LDQWYIWCQNDANLEFEQGNFINHFLNDFSNDYDSKDNWNNIDIDEEVGDNNDIILSLDDERHEYKNSSFSQVWLYRRNQDNIWQIQF